jgi:hypothetical protein
MFICLFSYVQDGKALPDGPVVISPDGLFPSLYREGNWWYMQFSIFEDMKSALRLENRGCFYFQFMLINYQASCLAVGEPCTNPDNITFTMSFLKDNVRKFNLSSSK